MADAVGEAERTLLRKLIHRDAAAALAQLPRPLVFTNGVFDILHRGHVSYLAAARALADRVIMLLRPCSRFPSFRPSLFPSSAPPASAR